MKIVDVPRVIQVEAGVGVADVTGLQTCTLPISRTGPTTEALTVLFTLGGTATLNTDYSVSPLPATSVAFAGGQSTATKIVTAPYDALIEGTRRSSWRSRQVAPIPSGRRTQRR